MMQQIPEMLDKAAGKRVLCIGDVMLDRYIYGTVDRVSPEAPVPVLRLTETVEMPGGAANVARNLAALGLHTIMLGCVGDDMAGQQLDALLQGHPNIESHLVAASGIQTVMKSRFVASNQQLLRVDVENGAEDIGVASAVLIPAIEKFARDARLIVVSDYAKGCITPALFEACVKVAQAYDIPLLVDPKSRDFSIYAGASLIKPNASELAAATDRQTRSDGEIEAALRTLANVLPGSDIVVTRAGKGMSWLSGETIAHVPGTAREVFDVSGAGDTSMAALAAALASGAELASAVELAVIASGLAVAKSGTATVTAGEIRSAGTASRPMSAPILFERDAIADQVRKWRAAGLRVGFTNGCFDILHPGHLSLLEQASARCDRLVVAINSDASVSRLKGPSRPVNTELDRARLLSGLSAVDAVTLFEEDTPAEIIAQLIPDLLVKGGDYRLEDIVGAETVKAAGGEVLIVPLVDGQSTTGIIARSTH